MRVRVCVRACVCALTRAAAAGSVVVVQSNGTMVGQVVNGVSSPMGVTFGCVQH